jgi:hypothetical protein
LGQKEMTVDATMDDPQKLLNTARRHCQAIQTIIDRLTETKSNTELRLLSQRLQRLAFHAAPPNRADVEEEWPELAHKLPPKA